MRTRILHFTTDSRISGAEKLLIGLAKKYNKAKYEVFFCTLKSRGDLHIELEKLGHKAFSLECPNLFFLPQASLRLLLLLKRLKIDILHTHLYHASVLGLLIAKLYRSTTGIMTRHYSDLFYLYGNSCQRFVDRCASRWAKHIIAISKGVKRVLVERDGIKANKITVIYNGTETNSGPSTAEDVLSLRKTMHLEKTIVVGSVGALHPRKGHRYLIMAADLLCRKRNDVKFVIVGDGALKKELEDLRNKLNLQDKVIFAGYRRNIADFFCMIDVFVQPSLEEGFGLTIVEAMVNNKPVIATKVGGIPEIIEDKKTGILVKSERPDEIANAIEIYLNNPKFSKEVTEAARNSIKENFSLDKMVAAYEALYETLPK